jgi:phosphate transport system ATP-binding protein
MVFQRPNPLPLSIRDNVLFGYRLHDEKAQSAKKTALDDIVEDALKRVVLWDDVKDKLDDPAGELSLEAQQKLCIARLLPVKPQLLLMDEPCSALDPKATEADRRARRHRRHVRDAEDAGDRRLHRRPLRLMCYRASAL